MRSLRLAGLTLKAMLTDTPILRAAVIAIMLVPLLYGALSLWAFWDPYGKLDQMPVALVNEDRPVTSTARPSTPDVTSPTSSSTAATSAGISCPPRKPPPVCGSAATTSR
jgi:hypothetical protein